MKYKLEPACFYLRKSREDQEAEERHEGETLSKHKTALLKLAQKYNVGIGHIYQEIVSGESIIHRPQMLELLKDIEAGKWKAVFCMDIDRLGRGGMRDQGLILDTFKTSKTLIVTPRKIYDLNNEFDEEYTEFETFMARKELKIINRRLQSGRRRSIEAGNYLSPIPPFGYAIKTDGNRRYLIKDDAAAEIIDAIFNNFADDFRANKIANKLNNLGYKTSTGISWQGYSVMNILRNPVYAGIVVWGKKDIKKCLPGESKTKTVRTRSIDDQLWSFDAHEPYISYDRWQEIQSLINLRSHQQYNTKLTNPLAGLIICSQCGKRMVYRTYTTAPPYIICYNTTCNTKAAKFEYVEARLLDTLHEWVVAEKAALAANSKNISSSCKTASHKKALKKLHTELDETLKQKDKLHDFLEKGIYDIDTFIERSNKLSDKIDTINSDITSYQQLIEQEESQDQLKKDFLPKVEKVLKKYPITKSAADKNAMLKSIIQRIIYTKLPQQQNDDFSIQLIMSPV